MEGVPQAEPYQTVIDDLPDESLELVLHFVGMNNYRFITMVAKNFLRIYRLAFRDTNTTFENASVSISCAQLFLDEADVDSNVFTYTPTRQGIIQKLFHSSASTGNLNVLIWAQEIKGYKLQHQLNETTMEDTAANGHLHVIQYMREIGVPWRSSVCTIAAGNGYLELFIWVRRHGCEWDEWTTYAAAHTNQFVILKWAVDNGCPWKPAQMFAFAARNNNMDMMKWTYKKKGGCFTEETCVNAAAQGNLKMLKWLRAKKCPWCRLTCIVALEKRHFHVLQWAIEKGCPHDGILYDQVTTSGEHDLLR